MDIQIGGRSFVELDSVHGKDITPDDEKMWRVRSTLMRIKRPVRVVPPQRNIYPGSKQSNESGKALDQKNPPTYPFDCEESCGICFPQFFPAVNAVNDKEAKTIVNGLVEGITIDLQYLRSMLKSQADVIATRWQKKTRIWRRNLLLEATSIYPRKLAPIHMLHDRNVRNEKLDALVGGAINKTIPDPVTGLVWKHYLGEAFHQLTNEIAAQKLYQDTWVLPYLDAETLSEDPLRLLGLLHHRTVNDPEAWLMFDNSQIVMAEHLLIIQPLYNRHCVVMQGSKLGEIVDWNAEQAHRWEIVGFNKAHHLLLAQRTMMGFLRKVVEALIPQEPQSLVSPSLQPKWDKLIEEKLSASASDSAWSTDSVRPFSAPPSFDPKKIRENVAARYRAAKDDLELLQTDPSYVQFLVSELSSTVFFEKVGMAPRWAYFVDELIVVPLRREVYFRQLLNECDRMVQAFDAIKKHSPRDEYDMMLWIVMDMAVESFAVMVSLLDYSLPFQRGLERNFDYEDGADSDGKVRRMLKVIEKDCFPEDILFWSLSCMGSDTYREFSMDPSVNFAALDDYIAKANVKDKSRISQRIYNHVSDMAVINEVICAIRSEKQRNRKPSDTLMTTHYHEEFRRQWIKKIQNINPTGLAEKLAPHFKTACLNNPWPGGKKDRKWLEQANASRTSLLEFWAAFRPLYAKHLRSADVLQPYIDEEMDLLSAHKSLEYIAEIEHESEYIQKKEAARRAAIEASLFPGGNARDGVVSPLTPVPGKENTRFKPLPIREKPKTRKEVLFKSTENASPTDLDDHLVSEHTRVASNRIAVKSDNLSLFAQMFPTPGDDASGRKFKWQHFLDAMADTGLSISQGNGSAVSFAFHNIVQSESVVDAGSIVFHRPHPVAEINPIMMRAMGKRMTKWFGWRRETFVEKKKASGGGE